MSPSYSKTSTDILILSQNFCRLCKCSQGRQGDLYPHTQASLKYVYSSNNNSLIGQPSVLFVSLFFVIQPGLDNFGL